jgi:hypothetical protein
MCVNGRPQLAKARLRRSYALVRGAEGPPDNGIRAGEEAQLNRPTYAPEEDTPAQTRTPSPEMTPEEQQIPKIALEQLDTMGVTVDTFDRRLTRLEQQVAA